MIARSRAECEHRLRALMRAARASLFERLLNDLLQADSTVAPPMASLHFQVRFGMERRARPPPIRLHLLPAVRTDCLRLAPISMLQQQFRWHLTFQLPPSRHPLCSTHHSFLVYPFSSTQRFGMHHTTGGITQTYVPELLQEAWPLAFHRHLVSLVVTEYSGGCPARGPHNSSRRMNKTARNCRYTRGRSQERVLSDAVENETAYWPFLQNPRAPTLVENGPVCRPLSAGSVELSHPRRVIASSVTSEAMCAEYLTRCAQLLSRLSLSRFCSCGRYLKERRVLSFSH